MLKSGIPYMIPEKSFIGYRPFKSERLEALLIIIQAIKSKSCSKPRGGKTLCDLENFQMNVRKKIS